MQVPQFIGFWFMNTLDWTGVNSILIGPSQLKGALVYTAVLFMTAIVPVASIVHYCWCWWYFESVNTDEENKIKVWLMLFPIMGILLFTQFIVEIRPLA